MEPELLTPLATLGLALIVDRCLGEYPAALHPVVWIGKLIALLVRAAPLGGWTREFFVEPFIFRRIIVQ